MRYKIFSISHIKRLVYIHWNHLNALKLLQKTPKIYIMLNKQKLRQIDMLL